MNSFGSKSTLQVGNKKYEIFRLQALEAKGLLPGPPSLQPPHPARKSVAAGRRQERNRE